MYALECHQLSGVHDKKKTYETRLISITQQNQSTLHETIQSEQKVNEAYFIYKLRELYEEASIL